MQEQYVLNWSIDQFLDKKHINKIIKEKGYNVSQKLISKCKTNIKTELAINQVYELCMFTPETFKTKDRLGEKSLSLISLMLDSYGLKMGNDYRNISFNNARPPATNLNNKQKNIKVEIMKTTDNLAVKKEEPIKQPETTTASLPKPEILPRFLKITDIGLVYVDDKEIITYAVEKLLANL